MCKLIPGSPIPFSFFVRARGEPGNEAKSCACVCACVCVHTCAHVCACARVCVCACGCVWDLVHGVNLRTLPVFKCVSYANTERDLEDLVTLGKDQVDR